MAILHQATISPTKAEIVATWLDEHDLGEGPVELIGSYRFDDPAGEVGIEGLLARRGDRVFHLPLTYRGAPLTGAEESLITTMEHSALGRRWVHHAEGDSVALDCFARVFAGEQAQATLEVHLSDGSVEEREPAVRVHTEGTGTRAAAGDAMVRFSADLGAPVTGHRTLVATWDGGSGVVAAAD